MTFELIPCSYTRSSLASKGRKSEVLETKNDMSDEYSKKIRASNQGVYEVISIRDRFCSFSKHEGRGHNDQQLVVDRNK